MDPVRILAMYSTPASNMIYQSRRAISSSNNSSSMHSEHDNDAYSYEASTDDEIDADSDMMMEDENNKLLPDITLPGPFVVLQGSAGDGMANTVSGVLPKVPRQPRAAAAVARSEQEDTPMESEAQDFQHVAAAPPPLGQMASSTAINPYARRGVAGAVAGSAQQEESFVVVEDDEEEQNTAISPADAASLEAWSKECRERETQQQQDWKESVPQCPSRLQDHIMMTTTSNAWWQTESHQVAILRDVPTKLRDGSVVRQVIGALAPGTTLTAKSIVHLDSTSLQRLPVLPLRVDSNDSKIYARGQKGVIQLLQVETPEGRTGYACLSLDGYALLAPGLPASYLRPELWLWRVTCPAGAFVREGLDLSSQHRDTIPYGSIVRVSQRVINGQGLSRLATHGTIPISLASAQNELDCDPLQQRERLSSVNTSEDRRVDGWCSELLNPLSGQRGTIAQPLPFPLPAIYRVTLPIGAVVRRDIELSSPQIGIIPFGSEVKVVARAFSEHPVDRCIERLQLAGNAGWISVRLNRSAPDNDIVVELVDVDSSFDPQNPGLYHLEVQREIRAQQQRDRTHSDLSSVDENDVSDGSDDEMDGGTATHKNGEDGPPAGVDYKCVATLYVAWYAPESLALEEIHARSVV